MTLSFIETGTGFSFTLEAQAAVSPSAGGGAPTCGGECSGISLDRPVNDVHRRRHLAGQVTSSMNNPLPMLCRSPPLVKN